MVGYYADALEATETSPTALAYGVTPYPYMDHQLGESMRHRNPDEAFYWEQVRRLLSTPLLGHVWRPTKVILYGDRSNNTRLREVVTDVLQAFLPEDRQPQWISDEVDPVFAGAMGAAEFAKRKRFWEATESTLESDLPRKFDL
ncbi:hypothetical protein Slin15195_G001960 [Septoria linicola]|uniref:Uncharacterized protein n=1 Tax=Septoria linicola TaxID=215465 RepID=A0A9Q9EEU1_9PEZI|nr:hypothetical protein Slin14017_G001990 [Septoria linicola]USW46877.1 hypothetical protein Slin15195_G001960 [Septoria linicola]